MGGLWGYALGTGMTNKFNQILDEKRRLAGNIELEKKKNEFSDDTDPLANKFAIKGTDIIFNTPNYEKDLKGSSEPRKRMLWMDSFYEGALGFTEDQWDAARKSNESGYDDFKHKFLGNAKLFWKRIRETDKGNVYQEYDYSGLKKVLPDMWRDLQLLDPAAKPDEKIQEGITEAFNVDDKAQIRDEMSPSDLFHIPYKFDKKTPESNRTSFDKYYGINFGKDVYMSSQYAGKNEDEYNRDKGSSPWRVLIPAYQWMSDTGAMTHAEANKEIAQMQINFGLSDAELIEILVYGTKKHSLDSEGGFSTRQKINQVSTTEYSRAQNAKATSFDILHKIEQLQGYVMDDKMGVGWPGGLNRFFNSVFKDEDSMIDMFTDLIGRVQNADDIVFLAEGKGTYTDKNSIFGKDKAYATNNDEVRSNIVGALQNAMTGAKDFYARDGKTIDLLDPLRMDDEAGGMGSVKQSMIETLAIGLAFQIAMVEQGSGGKAVSDQDFDRAYQRIKGKWFSSKQDVIATLNQEKFNMAKRLLRTDALATHKDYGSGVLDWYDRIAGERTGVLIEYKNQFKAIPPMKERTQRLINMYTQPGGGQIVDYHYGVAPDVLSDEGLQTILSNFTKDEAQKLGVRLKTNDQLNEQSNNNRKKILNNKGELVENTNGNGNNVGAGTVPQYMYAPDLVDKYLNEGKSQGKIDLGKIIDRVIDEISKDTERVFFQNEETNAIFGDLEGLGTNKSADIQLRMTILRQWMENYQKKYDPSNTLLQATRDQIGGIYGKEGIPESQDSAVHDRLFNRDNE